MELPLISLLIFTLGLFFSFLNGIIQYSDTENLTESLRQVDSIKNFFDDIEQAIASFTFFEFFLFIFSIITFTVFYITYFLFIQISVWIISIGLFIIIFAGYFLRQVLFSVGIRFRKPLINLFIKPIIFIYNVIKPAGTIHLIFKKRISGITTGTSLKNIQEIVETAHEEGSLQIAKYKILSNAIKFNQVPVSDIMTPRTVIFALPADSTIEEALNFQEINTFSRFPIYEGNSIDSQIMGYVVTKDILLAALKSQKNEKLRKFARKLYFIPENATLDDALNQFLVLRQQIFLVVDEFGGIEGLVTLEDLVETMLGEEIIDEADKFIDLRELAKTKREQRIKNLFDKGN